MDRKSSLAAHIINIHLYIIRCVFLPEAAIEDGEGREGALLSLTNRTPQSISPSLATSHTDLCQPSESHHSLHRTAYHIAIPVPNRDHHDHHASARRHQMVDLRLRLRSHPPLHVLLGLFLAHISTGDGRQGDSSVLSRFDGASFDGGQCGVERGWGCGYGEGCDAVVYSSFRVYGRGG